MTEKEPELVTAIKETVGARRVDALIVSLVKAAEMQDLGYNKAAKRFGKNAQDLIRDVFIAAQQGGLLDKKDFSDNEHGDDLTTVEAAMEIFNEWLESQVSERLEKMAVEKVKKGGR
ncbi:MAG: hypothetical protein LW823_10045 [Rickettsiales bacterium]|jgi:hypothetical protein|nr:hypothetical protein [Rickettsiales bacterium]